MPLNPWEENWATPKAEAAAPSAPAVMPWEEAWSTAAPAEYADQVSRAATRPEPVAKPVLADTEDQVSRTPLPKSAAYQAGQEAIGATERLGAGMLDNLWIAGRSAEERQKTGYAGVAVQAVLDYIKFGGGAGGLAKAVSGVTGSIIDETIRGLMPKDKDGAVQRLEAAKTLMDRADSRHTEFGQMDAENVNLGNVAPWAVVNAAQQAPQWGMAAATILNPALAPLTLPVMMAGQRGNQYVENDAAGVPHAEALADANFNAAIEGVSEGIPVVGGRMSAAAFRAITKRMSASARQTAATSILARVALGSGIVVGNAVLDATGEGLGQIAQDVHQEAVTGRDAGDIQKNAINAFAKSLLPGGASGAVGVAQGQVGAYKDANETLAATIAANQAQSDAEAKAAAMFGGKLAQTPAEAAIIAAGPPAAPAGPPLALPGPGQVAMPMAPPLPVTEVPSVDPAQAHADSFAAARAAEDARLASVGAPSAAALTASAIQIDPNDPAASIAAIAAAPITQIAPGLEAPASVDANAHSAAAGQLGGDMLEIENLKAQLKVAAGPDKRAINEQITQKTEAVRAAIVGYKGKHGPEAADNLHRLAAETFLSLKGYYRALQKPAVQEPAASTGREQAAPVNTAVPNLGTSVPTTGSTAAPAATIAPTNAGATKAAEPTIVSPVDEAAHEAAASTLNARVEPTPAQAGAGNYKMGHVRFTNGGFDFSVENPAGSLRTDKNIPPKWSSRMAGFHYGYDRAAPDVGDGKIDWLVKEGTHPSWNGPVFVMDSIHQKTGKFDEQKWMAGVHTPAEAASGFSAQYPKGWKLGKITQTTMAGYKTHKLTARSGIPFAAQPHTKGSTEAKPAPRVAVTREDYASWESGSSDVVVQPNPLSAGVERKTKGGAISVLRTNNVAHLVVKEPPQRLMKRDGIKELTDVERDLVSAGVADAISSYGLPAVVFAGVEGMHTTQGRGDMVTSTYGDGEGSIGVRRNVLAAMQRGHEGWLNAFVPILMHETWHVIDNKSDGTRLTTATSTSPRFAIENDRAVGDVIKEAQIAYVTGPTALRQMLGYPFSGWLRAVGDVARENDLKEEVGAQLWSLYNTKPELMQQWLPISYKLFKEIHAQLSAIDRTQTRFDQAEAARDVVLAALASAGTAGVGNVSHSVRGSAEAQREQLQSVRGPEAGRGEQTSNREEPRTVSSRESEIEADRKGVIDNITPEERTKFKLAETVRKFVEIFKAMPSSKETAAIAWAGREKRGWYRQSSRALHHVFGPDAPRFAALLAAMSPQTGVEANLENALNTWVNWVAAGRPTKHSAIKEIMGRSVQGNKLTDSVLDAWVNNSLRALTHPFPGELILSGPKVDSFMRNLLGVVNEVTNDSWMAAFAGVAQDIFGGTSSTPIDKVVNQSGKGAGYLAMSAHVRQAAAHLTRLTGELWTPAEVQETVWSWSKALYESGSARGITSKQIIENRELTDALINATPDFGTLLEHGTYADILNRIDEGAAGVGRLQEANRSRAEHEAATAIEGRAGQKAPFAESTQLGHEVRAARRLDKRRNPDYVPQFTPKKKDANAEATTAAAIPAAGQATPGAPAQGNAAVSATDEGNVADRAAGAGDALQGEGSAQAEYTPGPEDAIFDDFREDPEAALKKPGWAIITATREAEPNAAINDAANAALLKDLQAEGFEVHDAKGMWQGVDQGTSYLVFAPADRALALASKYGQDAITTTKGFEYTDGRIDPANHSDTVVGPDARKRDGYTEVPGVGAFSLGFGESPKTMESREALATQTPAFKKWFGDSKIVDEKGNPLRLYHGTATDFEAFDLGHMSTEGDWGPGIYMTNTTQDASINYAGIGPDLKNKIESHADTLMGERNYSPIGDAIYRYGTPGYKKLVASIRREATQHLAPTKGLIMPLYARIEKPFVLGGKNETYLSAEYNESADEMRGTLADVAYAFRGIGEEMGFDGDSISVELLDRFPGGASASEMVDFLHGSRALWSVENDDGSAFSPSGVIAMALQSAGFDGIEDHKVNVKFGSQRVIGGKMKGMNRNTVHYIAFSETQVKSATGNSGAFSNESPKVNESSEDRANVVDSTELRGDGRGFTDFFTEASLGNRAPDKAKPYKPVLNISGVKEFSAEYVKHRGNFDDHIATSIPGFREVQQAVGASIVESYQDRPIDVHLLDIAASEGAFNKAISAQSGGTITTLALDPNLTMAKFFKEHSRVKGAEYEVAAFGSAEDAGKEAWTEDDGTVIKTFDPQKLYDVVHESMGFQFISNTRNAQFARVKEMMRPDGIAIFEEKVKDDTAEWKANEAKKDAYKAQYFTADQMKAKAAEVLEKGATAAAEAESQREQAVVGMNDLMTTWHELETALSNNWMHVVQYWDAGNFKGYVASDSKVALDRFIENLPDLNSEYSTVHTPQAVELPKEIFSREVHYGPLTPAQERALRNTGGIVDKKTRAQRLKAATDRGALKLEQGAVDKFASLKVLDEYAYLLARMSKASDGALEALLLYGNLHLSNGVTDTTVTGAGFIEHMQALEGEHQRFMRWVAGMRAAELTKEDREHLFTTTDIAAYKTLIEGNLPSGKPRRPAFVRALAAYTATSRSVLNIAEESHIIDPESRATWEKLFYVPFYRAIEAGDSTPNIGGGGLVRQKGIQRLKGGTGKLNEDLLDNVLKNWAHLLSASANNRAARAALIAAENMGIAREEPGYGVAGRAIPKDAVWYLERGKKSYYSVDDPLVLASLLSLEAGLLGGKVGEYMAGFKRLLTIGVTANPAFKIRNLIRDSIHSLAVADLSYNVAGNVKTGAQIMLNKQGQEYASLLAGGGIIRFGSMNEENRAAHVNRLINKGVKHNTILNTREKFMDFVKVGVEKYNEAGDVSEGVNRAALYKQMRDQGMSHAEASFAARDLLDFSKGGVWPAVRLLTQTVPFLNARIQGLYRLGQGAKANPARFTAVIMATALASIALMLHYRDDDDWKKREDWDRDNYWWFKVGGVAYRLPKPFEVGVMATLAERSVEYMVDKEMTGKRFGARLWFAVTQTLSINAIPQVLKPLEDWRSNKDSFTGRDLESQGMEKLPASKRIASNTTATAKLLGNPAMSPVVIDHLVKGYLGWLGTMAMEASSWVVGKTQSAPARPSRMLRDMFVIGNFVETLPANQSRYVSQFYEQARAIGEAYAEHREMLKQGDRAGAAKFAADHAYELRKNSQVNSYREELNDIRAEVQKIERDPRMTSDTKRTKINLLYAQRNAVAKTAAKRTAPQ